MYAVTPEIIQSRQNKEAGPKTTFEPNIQCDVTNDIQWNLF